MKVGVEWVVVDVGDVRRCEVVRAATSSCGGGSGAGPVRPHRLPSGSSVAREPFSLPRALLLISGCLMLVGSPVVVWW